MSQAPSSPGSELDSLSMVSPSTSRQPTGAMPYGRQTPLLDQRYADDFCSLVFLAVNKIIWNGINPSQIVFDAHFISKTAGSTNGLKTRTSFKLSYDLKHLMLL